MRISTKLKAAYVALAATDAWLAGLDHPAAGRSRVLTKPLLMPTLAASLALDPRARRSPLRTTTLVAETAGWLGDLALMRSGRNAFVAGTASFAVGHAAYVTGFRRNGRPLSAVPQAGVPRAVGASWLASGPVIALAAAREERRLGAAVLGYSGALAAMTALGSQLDPSIPRSARVLTGLGAGLFLVSDSLLGTREFLLGGGHHRVESAVMASYTGAQLLLAEGAARA